ncbi:MAG: alpha/beta hydrolase, partial [Acidobacteriota bacterium]
MMPDYMPNAEPFFFPGNHVGCLLIHGFTGTPFEMRELGERLASEDYSVLGPALAGHATRLDQMCATRWQDWYASAAAAYAQLRDTCDVVFPIGLSMGALLALHLAAHKPVTGVVAVSAPFGIHSPLVPLFKFFPFLFDLFPYIRKGEQDDTLDPRIRTHHPAYDRFPTRCTASLFIDFIPHLQSDLPDILAPALLIQSRGDRTIPADSMPQFHARLSSREKQMVWLEKSGHLVLEDYAKEQAFEHIQRFVRAHILHVFSPAAQAADIPDEYLKR